MYPRRAKLANTTYLVITVATLLFSLFWLLNPTPTTHAQSLPEALGTIRGVVRNAQGDPLQNITVTLRRDFNSGAFREAISNAQGEYQFLSISPGIYKVKFEDKSKVYASGYYDNSTFWSSAADVNVSGNNLTDIDMTLAPGGVISVTVQPSYPITDSTLVLMLYGKTKTNRWELVNTIYWPRIDAEPALYGIADGTYALCANLYSHIFYSEMSECYEDKLMNSSGQPTADATEIIIDGATRQEITLQFNDFSQLQGSVLSATGEPLTNVQVNLLTQINSSITAAVTDEQGKFRFPRIYDGTYTLYAIDGRSQYQNTYYGDATLFAGAKQLSVDSTSRYSVTITMQPNAYIKGKVSLEGGGIPNAIYVSPLVSQGNGAWGDGSPCTYICQTSYEPSTGIYTVTGLATGTYRLRIQEIYYGSYPPPPLASGYYGGTDIQSADDISVIQGKVTPNINVVLGVNEFTGSILGSAIANGVPKPGINVSLFQGYPFPMPPKPFVSTMTDAQGNYRFDGLPISIYQVGFYDPQGDYAMTFYGGSIITPTTVIMTNSTPLAHIDGMLTQAGSTIRGQVKRAQGKNPADFTLYVGNADSWMMLTLPFVTARTDVNGNYEITGLPPATYKVGVISPDQGDGSAPRFYPSTQYEQRAKNIIVGENVVVNGINILFDIVPSVYLPNVKGSGQATE